MTIEKRLATSELVAEIRSSLAVTDGWIPSLLSPSGPVGVREDAPLADIARSLGEFANTPAMPAAVAHELRRAADAASAAISTDPATTYDYLGAAYAYLVQAHRAAETR